MIMVQAKATGMFCHNLVFLPSKSAWGFSTSPSTLVHVIPLIALRSPQGEEQGEVWPLPVFSQSAHHVYSSVALLT